MGGPTLRVRVKYSRREGGVGAIFASRGAAVHVDGHSSSKNEMNGARVKDDSGGSSVGQCGVSMRCAAPKQGSAEAVQGGTLMISGATYCGVPQMVVNALGPMYRRARPKSAESGAGPGDRVQGQAAKRPGASLPAARAGAGQQEVGVALLPGSLSGFWG
jgi:hypothetical protein